MNLLRQPTIPPSLIDARALPVYAFRPRIVEEVWRSRSGELHMSSPTSTRPRWGFLIALATVAVLMLVCNTLLNILLIR